MVNVICKMILTEVGLLLNILVTQHFNLTVFDSKIRSRTILKTFNEVSLVEKKLDFPTQIQNVMEFHVQV